MPPTLDSPKSPATASAAAAAAGHSIQQILGMTGREQQRDYSSSASERSSSSSSASSSSEDQATGEEEGRGGGSPLHQPDGARDVQQRSGREGRLLLAGRAQFAMPLNVEHARCTIRGGILCIACAALKWRGPPRI